jgi:hypothetical protein
MLKDPTARAILVSAVLVVAAILAHAWYTRQPRYQEVHANGSVVIRLDRSTGEVVRCVPADSGQAYECGKPDP